ncbi:catalase-like protein [Leptotrombidium deliense]|uniref:Catalase n=1 Tax=Leptotrombidium deliense TaxID=299467 RepID=A0A443SDD2_9ACAR|nr:catalase-like protein [Leptotrombidium deliense]
MSRRDRATDSYKEYAEKQKYTSNDVITSAHGCPIGDHTNVMTVGPRGPLLVSDQLYMEEQAHFDRERIPERVVHAKGAGAFGYFEVTKPDIQKYTKASLFKSVGKRTPVAIRFSTVAGELGAADTVRDPRGFAVKFYTDEGIWDMTGNNTPIFFIRDPFLFPSFIRSQKRNPRTHLKDPDMFWDLISLRPECLHQTAFLFSDRGIPDGYRHMNGYGSHTYKFINDKNEAVYCKFHFKTDQGIKNIDPARAAVLAGTDPDYAIRDLYNAIANKNFPSWTFYVQIMTYQQAEKFPFNPFDLTKVWPHADYPLIEVGKLVLDRNPENYFAEVEQLAFSPSSFVPGIGPSPDKMLQARLFAYDDTHRHRLGANFHHIPVNRPKCPVITPTLRDGPYCFDDNGGGMPNYFPNSFLKAKDNPKYIEHRDRVMIPDIDRHESANEDNYTQVANFWQKVLKEDERERLIENMAKHLINAQEFIRDRFVGHCEKAHKEFGKRLRLALDKL